MAIKGLDLTQKINNIIKYYPKPIEKVTEAIQNISELKTGKLYVNPLWISLKDPVCKYTIHYLVLLNAENPLIEITTFSKLEIITRKINSTTKISKPSPSQPDYQILSFLLDYKNINYEYISMVAKFITNESNDSFKMDQPKELKDKKLEIYWNEENKNTECNITRINNFFYANANSYKLKLSNVLIGEDIICEKIKPELLGLYLEFLQSINKSMNWKKTMKTRFLQLWSNEKYFTKQEDGITRPTALGLERLMKEGFGSIKYSATDFSLQTGIVVNPYELCQEYSKK